MTDWPTLVRSITDRTQPPYDPDSDITTQHLTGDARMDEGDLLIEDPDDYHDEVCS